MTENIDCLIASLQSQAVPLVIGVERTFRQTQEPPIISLQGLLNKRCAKKSTGLPARQIAAH